MLNCFFKDSNKLTVGQIRKLICDGNIPKDFSPPLKIQFPSNSNQYLLHILETKSISQNQLILKVTSYQAGEHQGVSFKIADSKYQLETKPLSWNVESVLKEETSNFYPPYGPWALSISYWYLMAWMGLFIFSGLIGFFHFQKRQELQKTKRRVEDRLKGETALKYFIHQLSQFFVVQDRTFNSLEFFQTLSKMIREFLENQFLISIHDSDSRALYQLRKKGLSQYLIKKISQILSEIDRALDHPENYLEEDKEQLLGMIKDWVFLIGKTKDPSSGTMK